MLFNKNDNGAEELKETLGFIYASNPFANIRPDIILAERTLKKIVGKEVFILWLHLSVVYDFVACFKHRF